MKVDLAAISGLSTNSQARVVLYASGQLVHAPLDGVQLQPLDATLTALAALNSTAGLVTQTGADAFTKRTLQAPASGLTITNPAGTAGDPAFAFANDLAALEALASTGIAVRTGSDAWAQRTIAGTTDEIDVTNGNGVSGNPTLGVSGSLTAAKAYRRGNILGAVSQSGGVPTGALIEEGSNANGQYVRFADGTQICVASFTDGTTLNANTSRGYTWTYPATFSSVDAIEVTGSYSTATIADCRIHGSIRASSLGTTSVPYVMTNYSGVNMGVTNQRLVAVGRWF